MINGEEAHVVVGGYLRIKGVIAVRILRYYDVSDEGGVEPVDGGGLHVWTGVEGHWRAVVGVHDDDSVVRCEVQSSRQKISCGVLRENIQAKHPDAR